MYDDESSKKLRAEKADGGKSMPSSEEGATARAEEMMPSSEEGATARAEEMMPSTSASGEKCEMKQLNEIQTQNDNLEKNSKYCLRHRGARRYTYEYELHVLSSESNSDFSEDCDDTDNDETYFPMQ